MSRRVPGSPSKWMLGVRPSTSSAKACRIFFWNEESDLRKRCEYFWYGTCGGGGGRVAGHSCGTMWSQLPSSPTHLGIWTFQVTIRSPLSPFLP